MVLLGEPVGGRTGLVEPGSLKAQFQENCSLFLKNLFHTLCLLLAEFISEFIVTALAC